MKKKILSLFLFSLLPLSSISFASAINPPTTIKQEATKIERSTLLSQNPNDPNRPDPFVAGGKYETQSVTIGSLYYALNVSYMGYAYSGTGQISVYYRTLDSFWIKDATYTITLNGKKTFDYCNSRYMSIISTTETSSGATIKFKLTTLPNTDNILFTVNTNRATFNTDDEYKAFIAEANTKMGNGVENLTSRSISYLNRESGYTLNDGGETTVYVDVDDKVSIETIMSQIKAQDLFGLEVPVTYVADDYDPSTIGTYSIAIKASDSYGQTSTATVHIVVSDYAAPIITTKELHFDCTETVTFENVKAKIVVSDNYYKQAKDITLESISNSQGLVWNQTIPCGEYVSTIRAKDASGNYEDYEVKIVIDDVVAPEIKDISGNIPSGTISVGLSLLNTDINSMILSMFKAEDNFDKDVVVTISKGTIEKKLGTYEVTLTAVDEAGNTTNKVVKFEVVGDELPVFLLNPLFAVTTIDNPLNAEKIIDLINRSLPIGAKNLSVNQYDIDSYMKKKSMPGDNEIRFSYESEDGQLAQSKIIVSVKDQSSLPVTNNNLVAAWKTLFSDFNGMNMTYWVIIGLSILMAVSMVGLIYYVVLYIKKHTHKIVKESNGDDEETSSMDEDFKEDN